MKKITFLIAVFTVLLCNLSAQVGVPMPTDNAFLKHTQSGMVKEIAPYSTGFVYISNDGTNDIVSYTTDGSSFTDVDVLESETGVGLVGWADNNLAFYLGNNTTDGVGVELRKLEAGSATYIEDYDPINQNLGPVSSVLRYEGESGYSYYFDVNTVEGNNFTNGGVPFITDGTQYDELYNEEYGSNILDHKIHGTMFNGNLYLAGAISAGFNSFGYLFKYDGSEITTIYKHEENSQPFQHLDNTSEYLYFLNGFYDGGSFSTSTLLAMGTDEVVTPVLGEDGLTVSIFDAINTAILNDKYYAIAYTLGGHKLVEVTGTSAKYYHLNDADVSDKISDMVVSGDYIYILSEGENGHTELYAINPSREDAEYVTASTLNGGYGSELGKLTPIDGGVAFTVFSDSGDWVFVSDGNEGNTNLLRFADSPTLNITDLVSLGSKLFVVSYNGVSSAIYEYEVEEFPTKEVEATVLLGATDSPIEGATVTFDNGLTTYMGTTDASGNVTISAPYGWLMASVETDDFPVIEENYYVGDWSSPPTYKFYETASFAFVVVDPNNITGPMSNGGLVGATVVLSNADNYYTAISEDDVMTPGFANFNDVVYGDYTYTVTMDNYEVATGDFTVDADVVTMGGPTIQLTALPTYSFAFVVVDPNNITGPMSNGGLVGATVVLTDGVNTYSAVSEDDVMTPGYANFTDVVVGEYTYSVSMSNYATVTGEFTVDADVETLGGPTISLVPASVFSFVVYDEEQRDPLMGGGELTGATVELSNDDNTFTALTGEGFDAGYANFSDVVYGEYNYTITMDNYESASGTFTVDANTMNTGGLFVGLNPLPAYTFAFVVYDVDQFDPLMGGGELAGATVELTNGINTYTAVSEDDVMIGFANFTDVVEGDYTYTITMSGYDTETGDFTVNSDVVSLGGPLVGLTPAEFASIDFLVYDAVQQAIDAETGGLIGAKVTIEGIYTQFYTVGGLSNYGVASTSELPFDDYNYTVSINGYEEVSGVFTLDATTADEDIMVGLTPAVTTASFAFVVYDVDQHDPIMGGGELEGATVELTDGERVYTAVTEGDANAGFANFVDVLFGDYTYTVTMDGYETASGDFTVDASTSELGGPSVGLTLISTGISETTASTVSVYPNPAVDVLQINSPVAIESVMVYSATGSLIKSVSGSINSIQVSDLPAGIYILKTKNIAGDTSTIKFQNK